MKTVVGLYDELIDAQNVVEDLVASGFDRNDISLVVRENEDVYSTATRDGMDDGGQAAEGAVSGAVTGGALGGLGGILLGLGALAIPGIGPVVAAGPIVAGLTGAAIGATVGGLVGALVGWGIPEDEAGYYAEGVRRGGTLVGVRVDDQRVEDVVDIMNEYGPVDIERRSEEWRSAGWTGYDPDATEYTADNIASERQTYQTAYSDGDTYTTYRDRDIDREMDIEEETAIPVMEEELRVGKRQVERGGIRVHSHIEETPVSEDVELREEHVRVERRPVDRPVSAADMDAFQDRTIEMRETGEEAVVEKRARVIEEVVIGKDVDYRTETVRDTVRRTEVDIDEDGDYDRNGYDGFDRFSDRFRSDYQMNYANSGYSYDQYLPAYHYGYNLASSEQYNNRNWVEMEPEVRRRWEGTNEGTWEAFKDAIRHGWEEVKEAVR